MPETKPHRRLSLTRPTTDPPAQETEAAAIPLTEAQAEAPSSEERKGTAATVRIMAYMTEEEAESLDDLLKLFRRPKPSKSDLLRAALEMAKSNPEELKAALSRLTDTTTSRRDSKAV